MTKDLKWRLTELPTATGVAQLVEQGILSKDEARNILVREDKEDKDEKIKALEEQIELLKGMVQHGQSTGVTYRPIHNWKYTEWSDPHSLVRWFFQ